jgi:hypothetical protein
VPLTALALARGVDTLGYLWHTMSFASDALVRFNPMDETSCRVFGVRNLVLAREQAPPGFARTLGVFGRFSLYEVGSAGYFGVVDVPLALRSQDQSPLPLSDAWLESGLAGEDLQPELVLPWDAPRSGASVLGDAPLAEALRALRGQPRTPAGRVTASDEPWSATVELARDATVVLRVSHHPGLRATVDGAEALPFAVVPGFAAVKVGAGRHLVRFRYEARSPWPWLALGALALLGAWAMRARTSSPSADRAT